MKHTFYTLDTFDTSDTFDTTNRGVAIIDTSESTNCRLLKNWYIFNPAIWRPLKKPTFLSLRAPTIKSCGAW